MLLIDEELRNRGLTTHCDKSRHPSLFSPEKKAAMTQNIDDAESILIFITQKFMGKVNGMDGNNDICKMEFEYALKTASSKIVLVILEDRMRNVATWKGQLRYRSFYLFLFFIIIIFFLLFFFFLFFSFIFYYFTFCFRLFFYIIF